jgi:hypothetical protein
MQQTTCEYGDAVPTSTFVQVVRLARDNALLEVEAIPVLPPRV